MDGERSQSSHEATLAALLDSLAAIASPVGDRATVRDDDQFSSGFHWRSLARCEGGKRGARGSS